MFKKVNAIFLSFILATMLPVTAYATNYNDLQELSDQKHQAMMLYDEANTKYQELQPQIDELNAKIAAQQVEIDKSKEKVDDLAVKAYRGNYSQFGHLVDLLLNFESFTDVLTNKNYYDHVMNYQNGILEEYKEAKRVLEDEQSQLALAQQEAEQKMQEAQEAQKTAEEAYEKLVAELNLQSGEFQGVITGEGVITLDQFRSIGRYEFQGYSYTWYSEKVLPGGGLKIPGRHVDQGCVCDEDGYVVVANDTLPRGTLVATPLVEHPIGKVYDCGVGNVAGIDIYVSI